MVGADGDGGDERQRWGDMAYDAFTTRRVATQLATGGVANFPHFHYLFYAMALANRRDNSRGAWHIYTAGYRQAGNRQIISTIVAWRAYYHQRRMVLFIPLGPVGVRAW